ncbi:hypothetical protein ACTXT7_000374 [Hymenolepis weldensis]
MSFFFVHIFSYLLLHHLLITIKAEEVAASSNTSHTDLQISQSLEETIRQKHEVQFHYKIAAHQKGHLTCEVMLKTDAKKAITKFSNRSLSHVYLRCPQVPTGICYVDCIPACSYDEVKGCVVPPSISSVIEDCQFEVLPESDKIILDYTIAMEALDRTGEWNCEYQGISAPRSLKLQASPTLPHLIKNSATSSVTSLLTTTTTATTIPSTTPAPPTTPLIFIYRPPPPPTSIRQIRPKSDYGRKKDVQRSIKSTMKHTMAMLLQQPLSSLAT